VFLWILWSHQTFYTNRFGETTTKDVIFMMVNLFVLVFLLLILKYRTPTHKKNGKNVFSKSGYKLFDKKTNTNKLNIINMTSFI
jgi:hypothetical protein